MTLIPSWSYTALADFENCPKAYELKRVLKVAKEAQSEAMMHGNIVHKYFEDRIKTRKVLPTEYHKWEAFIGEMERRVSTGQWKDVQAEMEIVFDNNLQQVGLWGQQQPRAWFDKRAWLRAKLDVVALTAPGKALVMDWKTGKRKPAADQLELFAGVVFQALPEVNQVTTMFGWLKEDKKDTQVFFRDGHAGDDDLVSPKSAADIWASWLARLHRLEHAYKTGNWPATPSGLCGWCPATRAQCTFSKK